MLCSLHPRVSVVCAVNYILEGALQLELLEIQVGPLRCISRGSMDNHILEGVLQLGLLEIQVAYCVASIEEEWTITSSKVHCNWDCSKFRLVHCVASVEEATRFL